MRQLPLPMLLALILALAASAYGQVKGTFHNATDSTVQVYWVGADNQNNSYGNLSIPAGGEGPFSAYPGTRWRFYSGQTYIEEYVSTDVAGQKYYIGGMAPPPPPPAPGPPPAPSPQTPVASGEEMPPLQDATFTNGTAMLLEVYYWDREIEQDVFVEVLKPGASATVQVREDERISFAASGIRVSNYMPTGESGQSFTVKPETRTVTLANKRLEPVELYSIHNASEEFVPIVELRPGETSTADLEVGSSVAILKDEVIIGSARVLLVPDQVITMQPDEVVAANQELKVNAVFKNQTSRPLVIFMEDSETGEMVEFGELAANSSITLEAFPATQWIVAEGDNAVGTFEVLPVPSQEFTIYPEDL